MCLSPILFAKTKLGSKNRVPAIHRKNYGGGFVNFRRFPIHHPRRGATARSKHCQAAGVGAEALEVIPLFAAAPCSYDGYPEMIAEARTKAAALGFVKFWQD
jgi:hypothetical protein